MTLTALGPQERHLTPNGVRIANVNEKEGLSRARLVSEALGLVQKEGLEALSMRGLADRLHVKAASLYWPVGVPRGRTELLAESNLDRLPPRRATPRRGAALAMAAA